MAKKNILVFPCGSEVALEIYRSLEHSTYFNLIGANSVDDHGKFVFSNYIGNVPFSTHPDFIAALCRIVNTHNIDAIYPAMDSVITLLKQNEETLGCKVIGSSVETTEICLSKTKTYTKLEEHIAVPKVYAKPDDITSFPVFLKPDIGYGSRGVLKAESLQRVIQHLQQYPNTIILEYLPGKEYTVDCFTDNNNKLLFVGPRERSRISNGISVNTKTGQSDKRFDQIAHNINQALNLNGAWFFQVKENRNGELVLMEVASRLGGSSGVYRVKGVNFAALSLFNAFGVPVSIVPNRCEVELDRALDNVYILNFEFNHVYVDLDDTLIVESKVNYNLVGALYKFINEGKKIHLITKHEADLTATLKKYRLSDLFDNIIHLKKSDDKWKCIPHKDAIFIDDSHKERVDVQTYCTINSFEPNIKL